MSDRTHPYEKPPMHLVEQFPEEIDALARAGRRLKDAEDAYRQALRDAEFLRQKCDQAAIRGHQAEARIFGARYDSAQDAVKAAKAWREQLKERKSLTFDRSFEAFNRLPDDLQKEIKTRLSDRRSGVS